MKRFILMILGILAFQTAFCQKNFKSGYIVSLNGDTVSGFVDYRNWEKNPRKILFKDSVNNTLTSLNPSDIRGFGVETEAYRSAIVNTEVSSNNAGINQTKLEFETDTAFLQTIVGGDKQLYFYKNKLGRDQFYIRNDTSFQLLIYKRYIRNQEGNKNVAENKKYLGQLSAYLQDCPDLYLYLDNVSYSKRRIEKLFLSYYECVNADVEFHRQTEKISFELGALAGISHTTIDFSGENFPHLTEVDFPESNDFTAGLFFEIVLPRNRKKWSIYNELQYTTYHTAGVYDDFVSDNRYSTTHTQLGFTYLKVNNLVRYKYGMGNLFLFVNAGISTGILMLESNHKITETRFYTTTREEEGLAIQDTRKFEFGPVIGLGTKWKKFTFELRHEKGNGMARNLTLNSDSNRSYLLLGYQFK